MSGERDPSGDAELARPLLAKPGDEGEVERLGIDEMLQKYSGEFGAWQLRHFVLTNLAWGLEAFHTMVMIFADREPAWRCTSVAGPECFSAATVCGLPAGSWEWVSGSGSSTVSEWGLICDEKYKVGLAQSAFFAGCMIGAGVFGHLSDSFLGRKGSLITVCVLNLVFGLLTSTAPGYWFYFLLRLLTGVSTGGVGLCAFVLSTEPVGPSKRGAVGMSTFYFFSGAIAFLAAIAYLFQTWRTLYLVTSIPTLVFLIAAVPFISESPRWYLVRGKIAEAMSVMRAIAETNRSTLPDRVSLALDNNNAAEKDPQPPVDGDGASGSLIDVLRSPLTRSRLILAVVINLLTAVVYYGLSLNVVNLKTNLYLNVALNGVAEMPAFFLTAIMIERFGRKPLTIGTMWFSGGFCAVGTFLPDSGPFKVVRMVCGVLGIFGMAGTYNLLFIYMAELFPTVVRNAALGCASQAAQFGAILAPMVVVLRGRIPFAIFALSGVVGGVLAFWLPETLHQPLYDTLVGMEDAQGRGNRDSEEAVITQGFPILPRLGRSSWGNYSMSIDSPEEGEN
ncbi:hypothetical protein H6P81_007183 [Aristolochia fimbriata]|uniref:Major facilitator superfamily (MFS) profile domain-containing protein n=1 Tax=Aristolochia fimbriata TaxID=158543 RepID=A0AAV7F0J5_ARIFI|nr:hypothetical protein H6P81_007183 [Aristolochia fimbriata]